MEQCIEVPASWDHITSLMAFADQIEEELPLSSEQHYLVRLVIEEIATNIIKYSYDEGAPGLIQVRCRADAGVLHVVLRDHGRPFDPRDPPPPDLSEDLEDRDVGGLGIFLVREMCDDIAYHHDPHSGWNELTVIKLEGNGNV